MNSNAKPAAKTRVTYSVKRSDLPLYCPNDNMPLWSSHPRVYLPIEKTGAAACPYCGTQYTLTD